MTYQKDSLRGVTDFYAPIWVVGYCVVYHQTIIFRGKWCLSVMDSVCFEVEVSEMYFTMIWRSKFTDLISSEKTESLGKNGCRQKCLDKSL